MRRMPIVAGVSMLALYAFLALKVGFIAELGRDFRLVSWREALFWLAHTLLATPGLLLIAHGVTPRFGPWLLKHVRGWMRRLDQVAHRRLALGLYALLIFTLAVVGRSQLLLDMPMTDDENTVQFAAAIVAEGQLMAPTPEPRRAFPLLFVHERDGMITSVDFPGGIFVAALARVSGLGSVLYALLAMITALAVVDAGRSLAGRRGAVMAAALWLASPMIGTLSLTTHSFLVARCFVALALAAWARAYRHGSCPRTGLGFGLFAGAAFLCRPLEATCLLTPPALAMLWRTRNHRRNLAATLSTMVVAFLPAVLVFAWYNTGTTGAWYLQARFAGPVGGTASAALDLAAVVRRLGSNLGFNLAMLAVWLLGPLGVGLVALGIARLDRRTSRETTSRVVSASQRGAALVLAAGVAGALGLALLHDDTGIHAVGPIHYSDTAVALLLLATLGGAPLSRCLRARGMTPATLASLATGWLVAVVVFGISYAPTLRAQAELLRVPVDAIEDAGLHNALVIADRQEELWDVRPEWRDTRSWMIQFPHPDPFLRDDVLIVYPSVPGAELAARFPGRDFYRMTYRAEGAPVVIERLMIAGR